VPIPKDRRIVAAVVLGAVVVVLFVVVAIAQGIGNPSVPSGDVAVVEDVSDGHISQEEFDSALQQFAAQQGVKKVPPPSDPSYGDLHDAAMADLLLTRWVRGEATERGISFSDTEISNRLDQIIQQDFGGQKQFEKFLTQNHFTAEQARDRVELQLMGDEVQKQVLGGEQAVSESEIEDYYEANQAQFQQEETLTVRRLVNKDQAKLEQAKALLEKDDSPASWKKVAARFSTEDATKDKGGLIQGVTHGQSEPALEEQLFSAPEGELVGPFKGQTDYYLIEVVKITPAQTTPLDDVRKQIEDQLRSGKQQQAGQEFQQDFLAKWKSRTFCADGYVVDRCDNFTPPLQTIPGAAPVTSRPVVSPGQAAVFPGQAPTVLPQGPVKPTSAQPGSVLGPGGTPLPPGGAPAPAPAPGG
jgi:foldase protein PrsA